MRLLLEIVLLFLIPSDTILPVFINTHQHFISLELLHTCNGTIISLFVWMFLLWSCPEWPSFTTGERPSFSSKKWRFVCSHASAECEAEWLLRYHLPASVNCWYKAKLNRIQKVCSECPTFTQQLHTAASNGTKKRGGGKKKTPLYIFPLLVPNQDDQSWIAEQPDPHYG